MATFDITLADNGTENFDIKLSTDGEPPATFNIAWAVASNPAVIVGGHIKNA